jgi:hypothetical protein
VKTLLRGALFASLGLLAVAAKEAKPTSPWENSVVTLEINRRQYDYLQPWAKRMETIQKTGVVVGPREVLTTAEFMGDSTLIRLQRGGRGRWYNGQIGWVDYHANLAIVTADDAAFWTGLQPAVIADSIPTKGAVQLMRWRNGSFESRKAEINRLSVKRGRMTFVEHMQLELDLEIAGAGWAEPIVLGNTLVGLTTSAEGNACTALPAPFFRPILEARKRGAFRGLSFFAFVWQRAQNPATLRHLKLEGEPRGVLVNEAPALPDMDGQLKPRDIILQVGGHDVDAEGDYLDPIYGKLSIEDLASRGRWAGDQVRVRLWRSGQQQEILYRLPKADYKIDLVPQGPFDREPEYLVAGGLLFQPLNEAYLRSWGGDWKRKAPFRLSFCDQEKPTPERPSVVVLTAVLPDPVNLGYQDSRFMMLNSVNGKRVKSIADIPDAMKQPIGGFHVLEFGPAESVRRMVLDAAQAEEATQRVLARYGIEQDHVFASPAAK